MLTAEAQRTQRKMIEWIDAFILPPHKKDLIIKVKADFSDDEIYFTGGYFDRDLNQWNIYGFENDSEYYAVSYFIIPEKWI